MIQFDRRLLGVALLLVVSCVAWALESRSPSWLREDPLLRPFGEVAGPELRSQLDSLLAGPTARPAPRREPRLLNPASASAEEWEALPGIGPKTAAAILEMCERIGGFDQPEDLLEVRGIGPKRLEAIRPWLRFGAAGDSVGENLTEDM